MFLSLYLYHSLLFASFFFLFQCIFFSFKVSILPCQPYAYIWLFLFFFLSLSLSLSLSLMFKSLFFFSMLNLSFSILIVITFFFSFLFIPCHSFHPSWSPLSLSLSLSLSIFVSHSLELSFCLIKYIKVFLFPKSLYPNTVCIFVDAENCKAKKNISFVSFLLKFPEKSLPLLISNEKYLSLSSKL